MGTHAQSLRWHAADHTCTDVRVGTKFIHMRSVWDSMSIPHTCKAPGMFRWCDHTSTAVGANLLQGDLVAAMSWLQSRLYHCPCETVPGLPVCPTAGCPRLHDGRRICSTANGGFWCKCCRGRADRSLCCAGGVAMLAVLSYEGNLHITNHIASTCCEASKQTT